MRLATVQGVDRFYSAFVIDGQAVDIGRLAEDLGLSPVAGSDLCMSWNRRLLAEPLVAEELIGAARDLVGGGGDRFVTAIDSARLGPAIVDPEKIICLGLNYAEHVEEAGAAVPAEPAFFCKFANSLTGPEDPIRLPANSDSVDYEGELAVIVGRTCKDVGVEEAAECIGAYTVFNDVSCRDLQMAGPQWLPGKIQDDFAPIGPMLITPEEIASPDDLRLETRLNGSVVQDAATSAMIFSAAEGIAYLSTLLTLNPGDVIATGTPSGVAFGQEDPRYLIAGDVVEVEIEGLGRLRNEFVAATA